MKQRDALPIFSFKNYYGAQSTTVLLNAADSVKYAVKTDALIQQHKRIETLLQLESINDLATAGDGSKTDGFRNLLSLYEQLHNVGYRSCMNLIDFIVHLKTERK